MRSGCLFVAVLTLGAWAPALRAEPAAWEGVDKTVVERFAGEAGRPPRDPYLNTDRGDLLLFMFLVAGAAGGFVAGYSFRTLFPPCSKGREPHAPLS
jgi:hypothetical protein